MPSIAWALVTLAVGLFCTSLGFVWGMDTERERHKQP